MFNERTHITKAPPKRKCALCSSQCATHSTSLLRCSFAQNRYRQYSLSNPRPPSFFPEASPLAEPEVGWPDHSPSMGAALHCRCSQYYHGLLTAKNVQSVLSLIATFRDAGFVMRTLRGSSNARAIEHSLRILRVHSECSKKNHVSFSVQYAVQLTAQLLNCEQAPRSSKRCVLQKTPSSSLLRNAMR